MMTEVNEEQDRYNPQYKQFTLHNVLYCLKFPDITFLNMELKMC